MSNSLYMESRIKRPTEANNLICRRFAANCAKESRRRSGAASPRYVGQSRNVADYALADARSEAAVLYRTLRTLETNGSVATSELH